MKELSIEDKAKRYDEALKVLHKYDGANIMFSHSLKEEMFPELKESEDADEKVRKALIKLVTNYASIDLFIEYDIHLDEALSWLEKQDEYKLQGKTALEAANEEKVDNQNCVKPADKVEPKFKVGDWVIDKQGIVHQIANVIENVTYHTYGYDIVGGGYFNDNTEGVRLWTIRDAKEGDVLKEDSCIFIIERMKPNETAIVHCCLFDDGDFDLIGSTLSFDVDSTYPATKEQRDLLFQKMKEAGYEWDVEKKELKKIEQKPIENKDYSAPLNIEIPFGAKDSELIQETIRIPDGCYAFIEGNEIVIKKGEKPAWSEDDKRILSGLSGLVKDCYLNGGYALPTDEYDEYKKWLKSLKDRCLPQPKQEWSEEDEWCIEQLTCLIESYAVEEDKPKLLLNWLKSLRPQKQWKPSDEQMEALTNALSLAKNCGEESAFDLRTLHEQLKKLRGE